MNSQKLKEIAKQLQQPNGDKGIEIANMMHETNINMTLHAIKHIAIEANDVVLELGHGNGKHITYLLQLQQKITFYGLETSELMYKEAKINTSEFADKQAFFHLYDGVKTPFTDDFFDKIFTVNTLYFWEDPVVMLNELYRIIKPNGILAITFAQEEFMKTLPFTQFHFNLYNTEKLMEIIKNTSFAYIDCDSQSEMVRSKTNELVKREYSTLTLKKYN